MLISLAPLAVAHAVDPAMHIPDGFLSTAVSAILWVVAIVAIRVAVVRSRGNLGERQVPLTGVLAAFIFAAQMLNFTVVGGTSGHFLGAALATILLGPWVAILIMTSVVSVQALLFQDGGLLALGANLVNMAIIGVFAAHLVCVFLRRVLGAQGPALWISRFGAAWTSIVVASLACALELSVSGTTPLSFGLPAMGGIHALIGIGEGLITAAALGLIYAARRDLLEFNAPAMPSAQEA